MHLLSLLWLRPKPNRIRLYTACGLRRSPWDCVMYFWKFVYCLWNAWSKQTNAQDRFVLKGQRNIHARVGLRYMSGNVAKRGLAHTPERGWSPCEWCRWPPRSVRSSVLSLKGGVCGVGQGVEICLLHPDGSLLGPRRLGEASLQEVHEHTPSRFGPVYLLPVRLERWPLLETKACWKQRRRR